MFTQTKDTFTHLPRLSLPQLNQLLTSATYNPKTHQIEVMAIVPANGRAAHLSVWHDYTVPDIHRDIDNRLIVGLRVHRQKQTAVAWGTLANAETVEPTAPRRWLFTLADIDTLEKRYHQGLQETAAIQAECREQLGAVLRDMTAHDGRILLRKDREQWIAQNGRFQE